MKPKVLIVDGHSVIFAWEDLSALHGRRTASARDELVKRLTGLQDASDWTVVVVFDGRGVKSSNASEPDGIKVFYSRDGQTADSIIERLVARYGGTYDVTVATDDHMERTTVESFGSLTISTLQLRGEIEAAGRELRTSLDRLGRRRR